MDSLGFATITSQSVTFFFFFFFLSLSQGCLLIKRGLTLIESNASVFLVSMPCVLIKIDFPTSKSQGYSLALSSKNSVFNFHLQFCNLPENV